MSSNSKTIGGSEVAKACALNFKDAPAALQSIFKLFEVGKLGFGCVRHHEPQ
jgi:hypothetical protein